jgi:predicted exporter
MRSVAIRSLAMTIVVGFAIAFLNWAIWLKPGVRYQPAISEAEIKAYQARPLADLESFMKTREVQMTLTQTLSEELHDGYYWRWLGKYSVVPCSGVFVATLLAGALERRRQPAHSE